MLRDSSFQVALGPPGEEGFPQLSLWHRGDLKRFEGSVGPQSRYGGLGLELSSGVGSLLPASSGRADIRLRGLVWRSGREYREFGLTATVRQPADTNLGGPSWSLAGAYGAPDSRIGESEPFRSRKAVKRGGSRALFTLDLKAGWRVVSRRGLFEPHAAFRLAGTDGHQLALGVDLGLLAGPVLKLIAERRVPQTGDPESRVSAAMQFRF